MAGFQTLPQMVCGLCDRKGNDFFDRCGEGWKKTSHQTFINTIRDLALALNRRGLSRGATAGIISRPSSRWIIIDLAIQCAGGITVPLFPELSDQHLKYELDDSGTSVVFTETLRLAMRARRVVGDNVLIVSMDDSSEDGIVPFSRLLEEGKDVKEGREKFFSLAESVRPEDTFTIIYTSGTTGLPKGVVLSQKNIVSQVYGARERFPLDPDRDRVVSCLPLAHMFERMVVLFYVSVGVETYFLEEPSALAGAFSTVCPAGVTVVPRILEKIYYALQNNLRSMNGLTERYVIRPALAAAGKGGSSALKRLYDLLVYRKLRRKFGGNIKYIISGGAPLSEDICRFFIDIGLPVYQGYGLTETSPVLACNYPGHNKPGSVGRPFPNVEIKIGEEGEILARGPCVMKGYHGMIEETCRVVDADGWFHTGDRGELDDDGFLWITGRIKELVKLSTGKYVCPPRIERLLCESPCIDMALVIADDCKYVKAWFFLDEACLEENPIDYYVSGPGREEIQNHIDGVNAELEKWERIGEWAISPVRPSIENEMLTPTMKLKRERVRKELKKLEKDGRIMSVMVDS